jgi:putative mycofactocin binding protein MftB
MKRYVLHPACRVRKEKFGLLFYDLRGPRLLFVETGDALDPALFREGGVGAEAFRPNQGVTWAPLERLLVSLVDKGFLREQPVC